MATTLVPIAGDALVHRLPNELLIEILRIDLTFDHLEPTAHTALARLANSRLLEVGTVCRRWHAFVRTPTLWACISLNAVLWIGEDENNLDTDRTARFLERRLGQYSNSLLEVRVTAGPDAPPLPLILFDLLCQHASRWREASFHCRLPSGLPPAGNLLLLDIQGSQTTGPVNRLDAPLVRRLVISGSSMMRAVQPLDMFQQLSHLTLERVQPPDISQAISILPHLRPSAAVRISLHIDSAPPIEVAPIFSEIGALACYFDGSLMPNDPGDVLKALFVAFTLPQLETLQLCSRSVLQYGIAWPPQTFSNFSFRHAYKNV
ncbi:hypothetical protein C8J57DRAFT_1513854 [Mycena rebaudengoi]|nr:hypothetical protein C8J57DRAFT_1513854 [Mycena rebaudengoi]